MQTLWKRYGNPSILVGLSLLVSMAFLLQCAGVPKIPSLGGIFEGKPPITTNLSDAVTEVPFLDDFDPKVLVSMTVLDRGPNGGFLLRPGLFELSAQSYCLHAGKYVPGGGDGYLYAPLKGPRADIIRNILQRSVDHPEIPQRDIQILLWAILSRTKISDMSSEMQLTAAKLLTPKEIFVINGGALGLVPEELLEKAFAKLSPQVRQVLEAEARLRGMLTEARATYEELERVAVRFGDAPLGEGSRDVPLGRWSYHPDGYFIRYFPSGYSRTLIQIYVPEPFQIERDQLGRITLLADDKGNRIETEYDDTIGALTFPGDHGIRGCAFRSIRFVKRVVLRPKVALDLSATWDNIGWTLIGIPAGEGSIQTWPSRFYDLEERYEFAKAHKRQLDQLDKQFEPKGPIQDIVDLGHYTVALKNAISGNRAKKVKWAADHIDLVKKAWQYAVCMRESGYKAEGASFGSLELNPDESVELPMLLAASKSPIVQLVTKSNPKENKPRSEYIPSGNDAVPANTSRQRLGISPRPSDDKDEKERACESIRDELRQEEALLKAFEDLDLFYKAEDEEWSVDKYYEEVQKRAVEDLGMEGEGKSSEDWEAPMETDTDTCTIKYSWKGKPISREEALRKYIEEFGPIAGRELFNAHEAHEKEHVRQCNEYMPGEFGRCRDNIRCFRDSEIKAYRKGIEKKKKSLKEQNCS